MKLSARDEMAMATSTEDKGGSSSSSIASHMNSGSYILLLYEEAIRIEHRAELTSHVLLEDVLGVETTRTKGPKVDLIVHGFPVTKKLFRGETRWRVKIIHCFDSEDATENERLAKEWKQKIIIQSRKVIQKKYNWYYEGKQMNCNIVPHKVNVTIDGSAAVTEF